MHNGFIYIVEPPTEGDRWYIAFCPEVPEANGQGETETAAIDSLRSCIELLLDYRREEGLRGVSDLASRGVVAVG